MPKQCAICGKKTTTGRQYKKLMSKYNPTPKKKKYPNLQWVILPLNGQRKKSLTSPSLRSGKRIKACTKCIKTLSKKK